MANKTTEPAQVSIRAKAPGKVVLAGEYAVLAGAPALVMAVNRFARAQLTAKEDPGWHFTSSGFAGSSRHSLAQLQTPDAIAANDPARLTACLLAQSGAAASWPDGLSVHTDSREMYQGITLPRSSTTFIWPIRPVRVAWAVDWTSQRLSTAD